MFLKRQLEVSEAYGEILTEKILNSANMWDSMLHGAKSDEFKAMLVRHERVFVDELLGPVKPGVVMMMGQQGYDQLVTTAAHKVPPLFVHRSRCCFTT